MTIITAVEVASLSASGDTILIDARGGKDAHERYLKGHLLGARFVDLDADLSNVGSDASEGGRHPLPNIQDFTRLLSKLGIDPSVKVMVYDDKNGAMAAARFWWMLKALGHPSVMLVSGGLAALIQAGLPITTDEPEPLTDFLEYEATGWNLPLVTMEEVAAAAESTDQLVIDVREAYRYNGESEPIDLVAGHIPGAVNVPFSENLDENGLYLPSDVLKQKYQEVLGDKDPNKVIVHCGSGVTACHTLAALEDAGMVGARLYVGSWSEWSRNDNPMITKE
ncbi:thiosulfate/3-mercaptopyruvate sulfurtransferase [Dyadobacter jejuensis]|uniref:Thiosulfate/3-mercaptopyruvate sulfurtransferase n=1 Tax=Dyadobacter jejuensis TaxID=1082580 RepID=A0A316AM27_9BACT|nr:sulfurtransferase [Dyadobacter jejuensis]PWJ58793.1 thiosulfate/3-mercaptopyruvate sulfurtransferase [Dyadobacter jejuensis]